MSKLVRSKGTQQIKAFSVCTILLYALRYALCALPFFESTYTLQIITRNPRPVIRNPFSYAFAFTGSIAFSGQIWAQTAQPVHRLASIFTRSFQI